MLMLSFYLIHFFMKFWMLSIVILFMSFNLMFIPFNNYLNCVSFNLGCDSLSYFLIFLTIYIFSLATLASKKMASKTNYYYLFLIILLLKLLMMTFTSFNFFFFYIFFEFSLIPMMLLILGWGKKIERIQSGFYFLFYTLFSSLPFLFMLLLFSYNFTLFMYMEKELIFSNDFINFFCLIFGFLVKMPIYMFHLWLPKAHVEAPVSGSMILAGIMLKLGGYGILRVMWILLEDVYIFSSFIIAFSVWGGVLISFSCLNQMDMKMIVAFSSISHMSMLIGGLFSLSNMGLFSALLMMISHGLSSSGMFYLVNIFYERTHSRNFIFNKGFINLNSAISMCAFMMISASMAAPPSINLLSEFMLIYSMLGWYKYLVLILFFLLLLSVCYSLYMYSFSQHGMIFKGLYIMKQIDLLDYFIIIMHWIPSNILIMKMDVTLFF